MPTLNVTIIAKNEELNLARALTSVIPVADEIIVTDTGSTDRTVEVARQFHARVLEFPWVDDFAAAHNFCIRHVSSDWIMMLDADEELLTESHSELRQSIAQPTVLAYSLLRQDLIDDSRPDHFSDVANAAGSQLP